MTPIAAVALAALVLFSAASSLGINKSAAAVEEQLDSFGVEKIYPTKQGGYEWYADMDNPTSNMGNTKNIAFSKNADGSWHVSARQIRMEAWSPENEKWHNVEITMYAKMDSASASDLLQMYSRGGHHSSKDPCSGSAYKARLYEDGKVAWTKEVTHPAYAHNRGVVQAIDNPLEDQWIGFKAVIYNFVENGNTYVRLESYIDDNVTDENGNLVIRNNWKLASVVEDRGGWGTPDGDFASNCGIARDAILTGPGGSGNQNLVAWRSDNIGWSFQYLSAREIQPLGEPVAPEPMPPVSPEPGEEPVSPPDNEISYDSTLIAGQHVPNDGATTINSIELLMQNDNNGTDDITIGIAQGGKILAQDVIDARDIGERYTRLNIKFGVTVSGNFDIVVLYGGDEKLDLDVDQDTIPGNYFDAQGEGQEYDLDVTIA